MYVVLLNHKSKLPLSAAIAALSEEFPLEVFTVEGSEEKGYKLRIEGLGDEKLPREFATKFVKKWKPPTEEQTEQPPHQENDRLADIKKKLGI